MHILNEAFATLTEEEAVKEAKRAKKCKKACWQGCPLKVDVQGFVSAIAKKEFKTAYKMIKKCNPFPSLTGRLCKAPCESTCTHGVRIKALERFIGDRFTAKISTKKSDVKKKVAIVGGGIAGMTAAYKLRSKGYQVSLLEALPTVGGTMYFRVPDFRLPKAVMDKEFSFSQYCDVQTNTMVGATVTLEKVASNYHAVIISTGSNKPAFLNIPGENLLNVFTVGELLSLSEYPKRCSNTIVVGGNYAALDAALIARYNGDTVSVVFEKGFEDMEVDRHTVEVCRDMGISFLFLTKPKRFIGDKEIQQVEFVQMMMKVDEEFGRRLPIPIEESEFTMKCSKVIISPGYEPNQSIGNSCNLRKSGKGRVWVNQNYQTTMKNVFASGELIMGSKTVATVMKNALNVADNVDLFLKGKLKECDEY